MRLGEANWILWGLALQAGLCPNDRVPLNFWRGHLNSGGLDFYRCDRCHRDWYIDAETGRCAGWWATDKGWTWQKAPGY